MKKLLLLLVISVLSFNAHGQCTIEFDPAGGVFTIGTEYTVKLCYKDYSLGFPQYKKARWNNFYVNFTKIGTDAVWTTLGGNPFSASYCIEVNFTAGPETTIGAEAIGNESSCVIEQENIYTTIPIELKSFDVKQKDDFAELNWSTLTETNFDYFTVEMSTDGKNFESITEVKGNETSREEKHYSFSMLINETIKHNPFVYFRLKQTDLNGTFTYSDVILLSNDSDKSFFALNNAYYNNSNIHFEVSSMDTGTVQARVTNLNGHTIYNQTLDISEGINSLDIPVNNSFSGLYILQVINNNKMETKKIFID